jgi:hypothetical protein
VKVIHLAVLGSESSMHSCDNESHYFSFTYSFIVYMFILLTNCYICFVNWARYGTTRAANHLEYPPKLPAVILGSRGWVGWGGP